MCPVLGLNGPIGSAVVGFLVVVGLFVVVVVVVGLFVVLGVDAIVTSSKFIFSPGITKEGVVWITTLLVNRCPLGSVLFLGRYMTLTTVILWVVPATLTGGGNVLVPVAPLSIGRIGGNVVGFGTSV